MKIPASWLPFAICLLLTGCFVSENPFYLEDQILKDPRIEGSFSNSFGGRPERSTQWLIQPYQPNGPDKWKHYKMTLKEDDVECIMLGTLFKIKKQTYLDLFPLTDSGVKKKGASVSVTEFARIALHKPRHTIWKIEIDEEGISYAFPVGNGVFAALKAEPELKGTFEAETKMLSMEGPTGEMQKLITKLAEDPEIFSGEGKLVRLGK